MPSWNSAPSRNHNLIRVIVAINFMELIAFLSPLGRDERFYRALKASGLPDLLTPVLQLWTVGSTIVATILFLRDAIFSRTPSSLQEAESNAAAIDGAVLGAWWLALLAVFVYAFAMGHA